MDWELTRSFFIALLAISNPISKIALWVQGSDDEDHQVRWRLALMLTGTAFIVLVVFLIGGQWFLDLFGVDLASFRVGGGIVIGLVGLDMIRGQAIQIDTDAEEEHDDDERREARSRFRRVVVPLAVPMMAGPGSISTSVVYSTSARSLLDYGGLIGALAVVMAITFLVLLSGQRIERLVGRTTLDIQTRVFGLILAGIAVQLIVEGLGDIFPAWLAEGSAIMDELNDGP